MIGWSDEDGLSIMMMMMMMFIHVRRVQVRTCCPETSRRIWGRANLGMYVQSLS